MTSLGELLEPLTEAEFLIKLRERSLVFQRSTSKNRYSDLLDGNKLLALIEAGSFARKRLRVTHQERTIPPVLYSERDKTSVAMLANWLDRGASIIVEPLDPYVPALNALCADIRQHIPEKIKAGAILSTGHGGALELHYDPEDLIILQAEGSKRWCIYGPPVSNPIRGMDKPLPPQTEPVFDQILQPGDFLFLPAGYWHHCENGPSRSLHIGLFIKPPAGWHAIQALVETLLEDETMRMPLTRHDDPARRNAQEMAIKAHVIGKIEQMSFAQMLAAQKPKKASEISSEHSEADNS